MRRPCLATMVLAAVLAAMGTASAGRSASDVRASAAVWLSGCERGLRDVVATETSTQRVYRRNTDGERTTTRQLTSEFAWVSVLDGRDMLGVRDVREVDGEPVAEPPRLPALLRVPDADRDSQVRALLAESVRLFEVPTAVNFNFPTFALGYLRDANAARAKWSLKDGDSSEVLWLRFKETDRSLVRTPEGRMVKAEGALVVEASSGRVRETSVVLADAHAVDGPGLGTQMVRYEAHVRYGENPHVQAWVPIAMEDRYESRRRAPVTGAITDALLIDGKATYTDYKRYTVDVRVLPR